MLFCCKSNFCWKLMKNDKYVACIAYYALLCQCASCRRANCCKIAPLYSLTRSVTHAYIVYIVYIQLTMILQMSLLQEQIAILFFLNSSWTLYCQLGLLVIGDRENVGQNFGMIQNRKKKLMSDLPLWIGWFQVLCFWIRVEINDKTQQ